MKNTESFKEAIYKLRFSLFLLANNVITIIIAIYLAARRKITFKLKLYHIIIIPTHYLKL